jgi:hypothetical protein
MAALRKSLATVSESKTKRAKAEIAEPTDATAKKAAPKRKAG